MKVKIILLLLCLLVIFFFSCQPDSIELPREDLFSLPIGKLEDTIDYFLADNVSLNFKNRMSMRDGIFYIVNGNARKIMELTSFGDLISLFYNEQFNPRPLQVQVAVQEGELTNKQAFPYEFTNLGEIAVDGESRLLVEDQVTEERRIIDPIDNSILKYVVLRFDSDGQYLDYIGQEGLRGTPFPEIRRIFVSTDNDVTITTKLNDEWKVYRFDSRAEHIQTISIPEERLPVPKDGLWTPALVDLFIDPQLPQLHLKMDFYNDEDLDQSQTDILSRVYSLDLNSGEYLSFYDLPLLEKTVQGPLGNYEINLLFDFIGVSESGHSFYLSGIDEQHQELLILDRAGVPIIRSTLQLDAGGTLFQYYSVSPEGVLIGFFIYENYAGVSWWRSDRLLN